MRTKRMNKLALIASVIFTCLVFVLFEAVIRTLSIRLYVVELIFVVLAALSLAAYYITKNEIKDGKCK